MNFQTDTSAIFHLTVECLQNCSAAGNTKMQAWRNGTPREKETIERFSVMQDRSHTLNYQITDMQPCVDHVNSPANLDHPADPSHYTK